MNVAASGERPYTAGSRVGRVIGKLPVTSSPGVGVGLFDRNVPKLHDRLRAIFGLDFYGFISRCDRGLHEDPLRFINDVSEVPPRLVAAHDLDAVLTVLQVSADAEQR